MALSSFKNLKIGETFKEESYGSGIHKNTLSGMVYKKISPSKAQVIKVYGNYQSRHIGGIIACGAFKQVQRT